jgi:hypothetical protein
MSIAWDRDVELEGGRNNDVRLIVSRSCCFDLDPLAYEKYVPIGEPNILSIA